MSTKNNKYMYNFSIKIKKVIIHQYLHVLTLKSKVLQKFWTSFFLITEIRF